MLVVSRKETDRIVMPTLGITIELLRIQGNKVRIGIDAPPDVPVYRHEIADLASIQFTADDGAAEQLRRVAHTVRQRLDAAAAALNALHAQTETSGDSAAQELVLRVFRELRALDAEAVEAIEGDSKCLARALVVEDDANERNLLASYLQLRGIETTTAEDGQDALDFLSLHAAPDVVLFDLQMPRCDGRCLVDALRSRPGNQGLKLFALSGTDPSSLGISAGPTGIDRWFPKPIDLERLVSGIAEELGIQATAL